MHFFLAALVLASAGVLAAVASPEPGQFAWWFIVGQIGLATLLCVRGFVRLHAGPESTSRFDELHPKNFFLDTWRAMDNESRAARSRRTEEGRGYDYRPLAALVVGAVCLTLMEYLGASSMFVRFVELLSEDDETVWQSLRESPFARLYELTWWAGWRVLCYFLIPALALRLVRERFRDQGLSLQGFHEHVWIYGFAYTVVLVCVVIVSYTGEFSSYYPFYKQATRSWFDFLCWETLYAAQFFSLEFFFRGYWLKQMRTAMGSHAIFAMVVPYCMIHYGKPMPETLAAIIAGVVLGTLAMKTRSIWSGFLIHVSVAISMDTAALLQTTGLPDTFWPQL